MFFSLRWGPSIASCGDDGLSGKTNIPMWQWILALVRYFGQISSWTGSGNLLISVLVGTVLPVGLKQIHILWHHIFPRSGEITSEFLTDWENTFRKKTICTRQRHRRHRRFAGNGWIWKSITLWDTWPNYFTKIKNAKKGRSKKGGCPTYESLGPCLNTVTADFSNLLPDVRNRLPFIKMKLIIAIHLVPNIVATPYESPFYLLDISRNQSSYRMVRRTIHRCSGRKARKNKRHRCWNMHRDRSCEA